MKVIGVDLAMSEFIVGDVSRLFYDGNVCIKSGRDRSKDGKDGNTIRRCTFSLAVYSSVFDAPGSRGNSDLRLSGRGPRGLARTDSACWHVHLDVISALLRHNPGAIIQTSNVSYTIDTYVVAAKVSAIRNVGVPDYPVRLVDLCECLPEDWLEESQQLYKELPRLLPI